MEDVKMKNKNMYIIIGLIVLIVAIYLGGIVPKQSADATITRSLVAKTGVNPTTNTVKAGTSFEVQYSMSGTPPSGSYAVIIEDTSSGVCGTNNYYAFFNSPATSPVQKFSLTASSSGVCSLSGNSVFATTVEHPARDLLGVNSITICQDECPTLGSKGCISDTQRFDCIGGNPCLTREITTCPQFTLCNSVNGNCESDCSSLFSNMIGKANAWVSNPSSSTKSAVLSAVVQWVNGGC
jgi:hypothetical protein